VHVRVDGVLPTGHRQNNSKGKKMKISKIKNRKKTRKFGITIYLVTTVSKKFWKIFERKLLEKV
jgi:hypothetical protein